MEANVLWVMDLEVCYHRKTNGYISASRWPESRNIPFRNDNDIIENTILYSE